MMPSDGKAEAADVSAPPAWPKLLIAQTVPPAQSPRRRFGREVLRMAEVGLCLRASAGPWRIMIVKPTPHLGAFGPTP
jgi:hypothetical protein